MKLPCDRVLVTVGTPCTVSAVGTTETHRALVKRSPDAIAFAACDAGLVEVDLDKSTAAEPRFVRASGALRGAPMSAAEIDAEWGSALRANMGIRALPEDRRA